MVRSGSEAASFFHFEKALSLSKLSDLATGAQMMCSARATA
jgi:hypothetical protein